MCLSEEQMPQLSRAHFNTQEPSAQGTVMCRPSHISNDVPLYDALSKLCFMTKRHPESLQYFHGAAAMVTCHAEMLLLQEER